MTLAAIEYTSADQMLADYAARRRAFFHKPNLVVLPVVEAPEDAGNPAHDPMPEAAKPRRDWIDLTSKVALRPKASTVALRVVVEHFGVSKIDIASERRTADIVMPRQVACWLMKNGTSLSLPSIGKVLGRRDHTTVLHAVRKIDGLRDRDADFRAMTDNLAAIVKKEVSPCEEP